MYPKFPMNTCDLFLHIIKQNINYIKHLLDVPTDNIINKYRYNIILKNYIISDYKENTKETNMKSRNNPTVNMEIIKDIINENISVVNEIMKEGK